MTTITQMYNFNYKTEKELHFMNEVMTRVRTVRGTRSFLASPASSALLAGIFLFAASVCVSISDVLHNTMIQVEWGGRFSYAYFAFLHSRIVVQALSVLVIVSCCMVLAKSFRFVRSPLSFAGNFIASISPFKFLRS